MYYCTMVEGKARTTFLSCQALASGFALGIFSAYQHAFSATGLQLSEWIPKVMWYCANGATMMQGTQAVFSFLRDLQQDICNWSWVVTMHANCHRVDMAIEAALGSVYAFVERFCGHRHMYHMCPA